MDSGHVTLCCFLSLALLPVGLTIITDMGCHAASHRHHLLSVAVTLLVVAGLAPQLVLRIGKTMGVVGGRSRKDNMVFLQHNGRSFPMDPISAALDTGTLLDQLARLSSPGQRLFVGPADLRRTNYNDTFLYYLLPQLTPADVLPESNPPSANRPESRLGTDVLSADWLILDHRLDQWNEPNESSRFGPDLPIRSCSNFELSARAWPLRPLSKKMRGVAASDAPAFAGRSPAGLWYCRVMMRWPAFAFSVFLAASLAAEDELPAGPVESFDIEPPLLIQEIPGRNPVPSASGLLPETERDPEQIQIALEKARKSAAAGERLFKNGVIAKVEAENRSLKVIRLETELAEAGSRSQSKRSHRNRVDSLPGRFRRANWKLLRPRWWRPRTLRSPRSRAATAPSLTRRS